MREEKNNECIARDKVQELQNRLLVKLENKLRKLDIKPYAAICACDAVWIITYAPFPMGASRESANLSEHCS
jgi:ketosteroid isomerase-like protein